MRPALARFVKDYFGDDMPAEARQALHAAIRADREAVLGHFIRLVEGDDRVETTFYMGKAINVLNMQEHVSDCWSLPTGLED